jgi:hypothetical protein
MHGVTEPIWSWQFYAAQAFDGVKIFFAAGDFDIDNLL